MRKMKPLNHAIKHAILDPEGKTPPGPAPVATRLIRCQAPGCQRLVASERIFCQYCTSRLRPAVLQKIVDAYANNAPIAEKAKAIRLAVDSLRVKKSR